MRTRGPRRRVAGGRGRSAPAATRIYRNAVQAKSRKPAIISVPPTGVTAPSHRGPPRARAATVPLKIAVPAASAQPARAAAGSPPRTASPTASTPSAPYIRYCAAVPHSSSERASSRARSAWAPNAPRATDRAQPRAPAATQPLPSADLAKPPDRGHASRGHDELAVPRPDAEARRPPHPLLLAGLPVLGAVQVGVEQHHALGRHLVAATD